VLFRSVERCLAKLPCARLRMGSALALTALAAAPLPIFDWWGSHGRIAYVADEPSFYPAKVVELRRLQGQALAAAFEGVDASFMMQGGLCMLAYYSRLPRIVDINGLTDRVIARDRASERGRPGHERTVAASEIERRRIHFLIGNQFPIRERGPDSVIVADLVPLRWLSYDASIAKTLSQRPIVTWAPLQGPR
jgi:hypothetical protein